MHRAHAILSSLSHKPQWTNADTASFDCMHYDGDAALDHLAQQLNLQPSQHVLDIGSGFSATGRALCAKHGVHVTGVELQKEVHDLAETITQRNESEEVRKGVRSVCADFLKVTETEFGNVVEFDHVVSLMCIMHLPQRARRPLFRQAARFLRVGGKLYIEDFCAGNRLEPADEEMLRVVVGAPYLPTTKALVADVCDGGFGDVRVEDVTGLWTGFVVERARRYREVGDGNKELAAFYDTVAGLFERGCVKGVRLTAELQRVGS